MKQTFLLLAFLSCVVTPAFAQSDVLLGTGKQPQVCIDPAGNVFVVYAQEKNVYVSASTDAGKTFGPPMLVENVPGLPLGMRRGPRIAATKDSIVITAISGERGGGKDGDVHAWTSTDQGKTWKRSARPLNSAPGSAREGLHAMAAGGDGTLACVWLDLRNVTPGKRGTEVWCTTSKDGGKTWSQDRVAYRSPAPGGTVCECCHPSVVVDGKGVITVMFRNALAGARDMYLTASKDGGKAFSTATKLGKGTWSLNACPMDGGSLDAARGGKNADLVTIWRRDKTLYLAVPGKPEQQLGQGTQPVVVYVNDSYYVAWMESGGIMLQAQGSPAATLAKSGGYPSIAAAPDGKGPVVVAWEQDGKVVVRSISPK